MIAKSALRSAITTPSRSVLPERRRPVLCRGIPRRLIRSGPRSRPTSSFVPAHPLALEVGFISLTDRRGATAAHHRREDFYDEPETRGGTMRPHNILLCCCTPHRRHRRSP